MKTSNQRGNFYEEPPKNLPIRNFDVVVAGGGTAGVVAGGGTAGVVAGLAAARQIEGRHFDDDTLAYGFHDSAPRLQIKDGGTYGIPYRALRVSGIDNLLAAGMMITSDRRAHMSTRNTVCCMGQGQAAGTAAGLCAVKNCGTRELGYGALRDALEKDNVYFET